MFVVVQIQVVVPPVIRRGTAAVLAQTNQNGQ